MRDREPRGGGFGMVAEELTPRPIGGEASPIMAKALAAPRPVPPNPDEGAPPAAAKGFAPAPAGVAKGFAPAPEASANGFAPAPEAPPIVGW